MSANLERIQIKGLYRTQKSIDARIRDNTLILVGENGSGKTTFLRILFNLLAGRWRSLSLFRFESAILTINGQEIEIPHSEINAGMEKINERSLRNLSPSLRPRIIEMLESGEAPRTQEGIERIARLYGIPLRYLLDPINLFDDEDNNTFTQQLNQNLQEFL